MNRKIEERLKNGIKLLSELVPVEIFGRLVLRASHWLGESSVDSALALLWALLHMAGQPPSRCRSSPWNAVENAVENADTQAVENVESACCIFVNLLHDVAFASMIIIFCFVEQVQCVLCGTKEASSREDCRGPRISGVPGNWADRVAVLGSRFQTVLRARAAMDVVPSKRTGS